MTACRLLAICLLLTVSAATRGADLERHGSEADGFAASVLVNREPLVQTAQILPLSKDGSVVGGDVAAQAATVLSHLKSVLEAADSGLEHIARLHVYVSEDAAADEVRSKLLEAFPVGKRPAATFVTTALPAGALFAVDAIGVSSKSPQSKPRLVRADSVPGDPKRSHAIILPVGRIAFISGQAEQGTLAEATRKTMQSLHDTLRFLKMDGGSVVQVKTFVKPMADVATADREIDAFTKEGLVPPVTHVEWTYGTPIEIEMIAWAPFDGSEKAEEPVKYLAPPHLKHSPVFSRIAVIHSGQLVFVSGISVSGDFNGEQQVRMVFARLKEVLAKSGSDFRHMAKATYYVSDEAPSTALNKVRPELYDPERPPAASKSGVKGVAVPKCGLVLDMIATPTNQR